MSKTRGIFSEEIANPRVQPNLMSDDEERAGDIYFQRGNVEMAYTQYTKSLQRNPKNIRVRYKRGLLLLAGGMNEQAKRDLRDPEHAPAYMGLGQALFEEKDYSGARTHFMHALEIDSSLWKCHSYMGIINDYNEQYEMAVRDYLCAIKIKPDNGLLYNNLGMSYYFQDDYESAIEVFQKALETRPDMKLIYKNLGLALAKAGRYAEAREAFKGGGDEAQAYNNLGCTYLSKGVNEEAVQCFEKAIELKPEFYTRASENMKKALKGR